MNVTHTSGSVVVSNLNNRLELTDAALRLTNPRTGHLLLDCPSPVVYWPSFYPEGASWRLDHWDAITRSAGPVEICIEAVSNGHEAGRLLNIMRCFPEHVELGASLKVKAGATLVD